MSEKALGKALKALGVPRDNYIVSTKCGRYAEGFDFSADRVTKSIDESLARLQLDYVDILQCHDIEFGSLDQVLNQLILIHLLYIWILLVLQISKNIHMLFIYLILNKMPCDNDIWSL